MRTTLFFILTYHSLAIAAPPLLLNVGEQRTLPAAGLKKFSIGQAKVAKARVLDFAPEKRILLKAIQPGTTDLWIWLENQPRPKQYAVEVLKSSSTSADPKLLRDLSSLQETEIQFSERKVVLRGKIESRAELAQIHALLQSYPAVIEDWTELSPSLEKLTLAELKHFLRASLSQKESARLRLEQRAGEWWINGSLSKKTDQEALTRGLRRIFPRLQLNLKTLADDDPTVHFRAYLLELKKSRSHSLGLNWPTLGTSLFKISTSQIQTSLQLEIALDALESDGSLKVLSRPEISVCAPGEAKLFSGGQIPIFRRTKNKTETEWKPFGLTFHLKVKNATDERVKLDIQTEVSHLDLSLQSEDKVPGIQASQMQTQVDASFGRPLFLSGLIQHSLRESGQGLPFLKDLPVLGSLFGSRDFQTQKSELVAILLPEHAPPIASAYGRRITIQRRHTPQGWIPIPRNWLSPDEEAALKSSPQFPFNALEDNTPFRGLE